MNAHPHSGTHDPDIEPDIGLGEGQRLPTAEAVLAATLALMTGHAQACCEAHRWVMLTKIVANLHLLAHHPGVSPGFKTVAEQLYAMWARLREQWQAQDHGHGHGHEHGHGHGHGHEQENAPRTDAPPAPPQSGQAQPAKTCTQKFTQPRVLWHASPEILQ